MARRFHNHYYVDLGEGQQPFKISQAEWSEALTRGRIHPTHAGSHTARVAHGVIAWRKGGTLHLLPLVRMSTFAAGLYRAWLYRTQDLYNRRPGEHWTEWRERVKREAETESYIEALQWQASRGSKGRNSLHYMPVEHKLELLKAFGFTGNAS